MAVHRQAWRVGWCERTKRRVWRWMNCKSIKPVKPQIPQKYWSVLYFQGFLQLPCFLGQTNRQTKTLWKRLMFVNSRSSSQYRFLRTAIWQIKTSRVRTEYSVCHLTYHLIWRSTCHTYTNLTLPLCEGQKLREGESSPQSPPPPHNKLPFFIHELTCFY